MSNKEIANHFDLLSKLLDIHGDKSYRSKTYSIAAYRINQLEQDLQSLNVDQITKIEGIGSILSKKIEELLKTGKLSALNRLVDKTPPEILEMTAIKGIGPKKIHGIWKLMNITTIGELLHACEENRLSNFKGFGKKTQENIKKAIEFYLSQKGRLLYSKAEELVTELKALFQNLFSKNDIYITGSFARQNETINRFDFVIPLATETMISKLQEHESFSIQDYNYDHVICSFQESLPIHLYSAVENPLPQIFVTTGSPEFVKAFVGNNPNISLNTVSTEKELFKKAVLQFVPPFLRESANILELAKENQIPEVIQPHDIKGIIHSHSNWSDGINTIEQMAKACIKDGMEYLVISDHSKAAAYANGLQEERIQDQHKLIDELNVKLAPFKIFKSIECDILADGQLDYDSSVLATMDLVIASIHSNLQMTEEKAMNRLIRAIENPYTRILGHLTGRLLLLRPGYPVNYERIIDACAQNRVVIEINANPRRLDMSWQWIPYALKKGVLLSVNPDAHSIEEFKKTKYGVLVAQKGMLTAKHNLSSFTLQEFEHFLKTSSS